MDNKETEDEYKIDEDSSNSYAEDYSTDSDGDSSEDDSKKKMFKYILWGVIGFFVLLFILVIFVSNNSSSNSSSTETQNEEKEVSMQAGDKITLEYDSESFSWNSTDKDVAIITEDGQIEALKEGDTTITVKVDNATYIIKVHVEGTNYVVEKIDLNKEELELKVDEKFELVANISPKEAKDSELVWSSSNEKVATVDDNGRVTAKAVGSSTITVKSGNGNTAICIVKVLALEDEDDDFDEIVFDVSSVVLKDNIKYTLDYSIKPSTAKVKLIWESSDPSVATVEDGVIKTLAPGTTAITAKKANKEATLYVTVVKGSSSTPDIIDDGKEVKAVSINLNQTELNMKNGNSFTLVAEISPSNTTNKTITYTSADTNVATVDSKGKVVAVADGETTITATTSNGVTAQVKVVVSSVGQEKEIESISLGIKNISLSPGNSIQLVETYSPSDATVVNLTWTSSNPGVASVTNGLVTAISSGTAVITVSNGKGVSATCNVTVSSSVVTLTNITISPSEVSLKVNGTTHLTVEFYPGNATNKTITWSSSNKSVVTVDGNGNVTGKKAGHAVIFATSSNGIVAVASVTVN